MLFRSASDGKVSTKTISETAALVRMLMIKYSISASNVVRHYDITHKTCPTEYVNNANWKSLHNVLTDSKSELVVSNKEVNPYTEPSGTIKYNVLTKSVDLKSVRWLQWQINQHGYGLQVDGKFGPATLSTVKAFQKSKGLDADGICGKFTKAELKK